MQVLLLYDRIYRNVIFAKWKGAILVKLVIGCDHGALELKEAVKKVLAEFDDIQVEDMGTYCLLYTSPSPRD